MDEGVVLETERLLLRNFTLDDVPALEAVIGDPVAMRWYAAPFDHDGVIAWIERNLNRYQHEGHGLWAMVLKSSGEFIGDCGCVLQEVEDEKAIEVAYHVRRDLWGNGYATEAARACIEFAFNKLGAQRVISMIRPENVSSRRVAEKNGLTCEKIVFWKGFDHCLYAKENL
ncbi:MAG TPA: GNAT family N-acetyltransferase [Candidatus Angelobacter sp.]|nr:GNAT family N-acetyltransferase [Candidatus Angelobacter sp.]